MSVRKVTSASACVVAGLLLALAYMGLPGTTRAGCPIGRPVVDGYCTALDRSTTALSLAGATVEPTSVDIVAPGSTVGRNRSRREASSDASLDKEPLARSGETPLLRRLGSAYFSPEGTTMPAVPDDEFAFALLRRLAPEPKTEATCEPPSLVGKALVVDQEAQVLRVYEDAVQIRVFPASSGVPPLYTPAYVGHVGHYVSTIYGYGSLADDAWYIFTASGNIYIHSLPYTLSGDVKLYEGAKSLGVRPSSHGCIRLDPDNAEWLTQWDPRGVPILITPLDLSKEW